MLNMKWFVFQEDVSLSDATIHGSYREAKKYAQGSGQVEDAPQRLCAGWYILRGCSGTLYNIASNDGLRKTGHPNLASN